MRLLRIGVRGFRNLQEAQIETAPRFSVFHGENAQGKTNLIEAVYLLSNLQSFRTRRPRELAPARSSSTASMISRGELPAPAAAGPAAVTEGPPASPAGPSARREGTSG